MKDYLIDEFFIFIISILLVSVLVAISYVQYILGNYQYECITLDNETITCDRVNTTEGGIIGTRDDTSYLIKQYKKVKKDKKDE